MRIELDNVGGDDWRTDGLNHPQSLPCRHAARLPMRDSGSASGIEAIHVERDVDRSIQRRSPVVPKVLHLDHFYAESAGLFALMAMSGANSHLDQPLRQAVFEDARKRAGVRE